MRRSRHHLVIFTYIYIITHKRLELSFLTTHNCKQKEKLLLSCESLCCYDIRNIIANQTKRQKGDPLPWPECSVSEHPQGIETRAQYMQGSSGRGGGSQNNLDIFTWYIQQQRAPENCKKYFLGYKLTVTAYMDYSITTTKQEE